MAVDILRFVDSPDVRQHMRDIGFQPSTAEAAFLVWRCHDATLQERFEAWEYIIGTMPNCAMTRCHCMLDIPDFHEFLRQHMALQRRKFAQFKETDGYVYLYGSWNCHHADGEMNELYSTFEGCVAAAVAYARDDTCGASSFAGPCIEMCPRNDFEHDAYGRYIVKRCVNAERQGRESICEINANGEVLRIDCALSGEDLNLDEAFYEMCFDFPTPFHAGDVLCNWHTGGAPFVLTKVRLWGVDLARREIPFSEQQGSFIANADKRRARYLAQGGADNMDCFGFALQECKDGEPYLWEDDFGVCDTLDAAYYRRPLAGKYRVLKPISEFFKGNSGIEAVVNAVVALTQQTGVDNRLSTFRSQYVSEYVESMGLAEAPAEGERE